MDTHTLLALLYVYRYWLLFPLALAEGPIVAVFSGWLIAENAFELIPVYCILVCGDLIPDAVYYYIGQRMTSMYFIERYGKRVGITHERFAVIEDFWKQHPYTSALLSKWAYGLSAILLMSAGLVHFPLKKFLTATVSVSIVQYGLLLLIGYYFGSSYKMIDTYLQYAGIAITITCILFLSINFLIAHSVKKIVLRTTA